MGDDRYTSTMAGGCLAPALLLVAATGPAMHVLGLSRQGIEFLWGDFAQVGLHYGLLALSGICAAVLITKRGAQTALRGIAVVAFVANILAVAYGAYVWRLHAEEQLGALSVAPVEAPVGILIAPVSNSPDALATAAQMRDEIDALIRGGELDAVMETRQVAPVPSLAQAEALAARLGAQVVVWGVDRGRDAAVIDYYVLGLGTNQRGMALNPESLLLMASSRVNFGVRQLPALGEEALSLGREVLPLVAAGHGALAADDALMAGGFYSATLRLGDVPSDQEAELRRLLGTALLRAGRPDLAAEQFALALASDGKARVGLGLTALLLGDGEVAASHLNRAIEQDPYDPMAYLALAALSIKQQHASRAIGAATRAVSLEPDWAPAHAMLGLAYELESDVPAAVRSYGACERSAQHLEGLAEACVLRARAVAEEPPTPVPTLTPWPTPTPTAVPTEGVYQVRRGDTLQRIADQLGIDMKILIELNRLDDPHSLYVGQYLILPEEP